MARGRGVAYFAGNYIKVTGWHQLREGDELRINDREYILKKKRFGGNTTVWVGGILGLVLLIVGIAYVFGRDSLEHGRIVGIALDDSNQPYVQQATIRFPDLGKTVTTDGQALFIADDLPPGSHKVELLMDGKVVAVDHATVAGGRITTLALRATPTGQSPTDGQSPTAEQLTATGSAPPTPRETVVQTPPRKSKTRTARTGKRRSKSSGGTTTSRYAKLALEANVEGAKLTLDGSTIGAGNLTYTRLEPGRHKYVVSRDGYYDVAGTVELRAGRTRTLKVTLQPLSSETKAETYDEQDFLQSGRAALEDGRYADAVTDLSAVIENQPSNATAYRLRGDALAAQGETAKAVEDYIRAAEIYRFEGETGAAMTAYNRVLELHPKSTTALLGRGDLYLARGEEIAAVTDFERAIRLDKHNAQAYVGLGRARYRQGLYKQAVKQFKNARSLDNTLLEAHRGLMLSYLKLGKLKDVQKAYERFVKAASEEQVSRFLQDPKNEALVRVLEATAR